MIKYIPIIAIAFLGCREVPQYPKRHGVIIGYNVVLKRSESGDCRIWYKNLYNLDGKRFSSITVFNRSICCCKYDSVKLGVTSHIPDRFSNGTKDVGQ